MARRDIAELLQVPTEEHDIAWLHDALKWAVELEFATIPIYLSGMWSIKDQNDPVHDLVLSVVMEEMLHLGFACNMVVAIGGTPQITAPVYPAIGLPGNVRPELPVYLSGLSKQSVAMYMQIELPENPLAFAVETFPTIGAFYDAISTVFGTLAPPISQTNQLSTTISVPGVTDPEPLTVLTSVDDVQKAIALIKDQGEGTSQSPDVPDTDSGAGELAHYYRFGEIYYGKKLIEVDGGFQFEGDPVPFPDCFPVAQIPPGGYSAAAFPNRPAAMATFDASYAQLIGQLENAWTGGGDGELGTAIGTMFDLSSAAADIVSVALPDGSGNYGPDFVPANATSATVPGTGTTTGTGTPAGTVSFKADIVPLFTAVDSQHMNRLRFPLTDFTFMSQPANAKNVLKRVSDGTMPPRSSGEPAWGPDKIGLLQSWIDEGFQP
jgi:hypothetical protein